MKQFITHTSLALVLSFSTLAFAKTSYDYGKWDYLTPTRDQVIANLNITEILKRKHYNKVVLDEAQSQKIYANYLKSLDPARIYFTAEDIKEFNQWQNSFTNFVQKGDLYPAYTMYKRKLVSLDQYLNYALETLNAGVDKMNFNVDESFVFDREKAPWAKNTKELHDLWRKRLKDEVLRLKLAGKEDKAIQDLLVKRYKNHLSRVEQTRSEDVFQTYINAFTETYDPHTNYLSPDNAENFDINMSLSLEGIGAVLQADNEYTKIVRLMPAGPAEKSKLLATSDRIVSVGQGTKGEMVDVIGWRLDEVVKLIRGKKGSQVRLEIIPATNAPNDLTSKIITITREAVKLEEQAARKWVLNVKENNKEHKIGVIEIPAFYLDFKAYRSGDANYKSTTRDVKKLISELQQEKVEGIIIDLRNNGGGSLQEAQELTSLFIDSGPTVLVRDSRGGIDRLEDGSKGAYYSGPLAVVVNRLSASASEIFAGAMQDYNRALIVGGQTFGKGTVQTVQPLNHGELKYTLAKFYRVSGQSTQHKGVVPHISYPAVVNIEEIGESALPEALPWDTIKPAIKPKKDSISPYLAQLTSKHEQRIKTNPDFVYNRDRLALANELMKQTTVSLDFKKRKAEQTEIENKQLALENAKRTAKGEELLKEVKQEDDDSTAAYLKALEEEKNKKPEQDADLVETGNILIDWISLKK